jgi:S-adenosylmethionine synthetase
MIKFSEYVSIGHPDKIADYISQLFTSLIKHIDIG